ncbi:MAG: cupin domain-containing protein [Actinomycetota bacterium]
MSELRVSKGTELPRLPLAEKIDITPLVGDAMNLNVVFMEPNAIADVHVHVEEQIGYIVRGACVFTDGKTQWSLEPGDVYHALPNVPHGAIAGADGCTIIDVFSPPREAVLKALEQLR